MRQKKAAKFGKKKRKGQLIFIGIIGAVVIIIAFGVYNFVQNPPRSAEFGAIGSTHEHAALKLFINDEELVDFSKPQYQLRSRFIHFEDNNGVIIHMHATGVDQGFLIQSVRMEFDDQCIILSNGSEYCNDGDKTLKFFVNGVRNDLYDKYVLKDGDKFLITYGIDAEEQIKAQLNTLDLIPVPVEQP